MAATIRDEKVLRYLREMIQIPSVNPSLVPGGAGEREMAHYLLHECRALGLETCVEGAPDRPNVVAVLKGTGKGRSLMLCGHMDTVGVDGMEIDPFNASCCDGKVYGRGAVDMKGGLASIMGAIDALVNSGFQPRGDVVVAGVADEEYASGNCSEGHRQRCVSRNSAGR